MLGQDVTYERVPYFNTDQDELGMEYSGYVGPDGYDQVVFRGDVDKLEFIAFWLAGGRVLAGMNVNVWDVTDSIQALVGPASPSTRPGSPTLRCHSKHSSTADRWERSRHAAHRADRRFEPAEVERREHEPRQPRAEPLGQLPYLGRSG
jgi:hypothetical protein